MTSSTNSKNGSVFPGVWVSVCRLSEGYRSQVPGPAAASFQQDYLSLRDSRNSEISVLGVLCKWCELGNYDLTLGGWAKAEKEWIRCDIFCGHFRILYPFTNSFDYFSRTTMTRTHLTNPLNCLSLLGCADKKNGSDLIDRTSPTLGILLI